MSDYDFSDWESDPHSYDFTDSILGMTINQISGMDLYKVIGDSVNTCVRENLQTAFGQFGNGFWMTSMDLSSVVWNSEWDSDPIAIALSPEDLKRALLNDISEDPDEMRKVVDGIEAWAASINETLVEARSALERSCAGE